MRTILALLALFMTGCAEEPAERTAQAAVNILREPDVEYEPTPQPVVEQMLRLAEVKAGDVVYDLGSGDGRIPITAVRVPGVRGVGIDIDPVRIREANANARAAGVTDRVSFRNEDLFKANFAEATVVTLFLYPDLNLKIRPRLLAELRPGTRVVSYWHHMGDWQADRTERAGNARIYLWTIPARP
jgi:SAM-dependent methyltransferase